MGFPGGLDGKEYTRNMIDVGLIPGSGRSPWRRAWHPTPGFLPGESPGTEDPSGLQSVGSQSQTRPKQLSTAHDHFVKGFNGINGQYVRTDGPGDSEMEILRKEQEEVPGHWCDPWSGKTPYASEELSLCPTVTEDCVPSPICSQ